MTLQTRSLIQRFRPLYFFGLCMLLVLFAGCAGLSKRIQDNDILLTLTVKQFTYEYVTDDAGYVDRDKARSVYAHAKAMQDYTSTIERVTVLGLENYLYSRTDWTTKTPLERQRAELYIAGLSSLLERQAREGELLPDSDGHVRIAVDFLINTVIEALEPYQ